MTDSISKRDLWRYVNKKINRFIHHYHVFSIITILFEEILYDLKRGEDIKIFNLGTISLQETSPRWYHNVVKKQLMLSDKHRILRFVLTSKIKKKLCSHLNIDLTFQDD